MKRGRTSFDPDWFLLSLMQNCLLFVLEIHSCEGFSKKNLFARFVLRSCGGIDKNRFDCVLLKASGSGWNV